MFQPSPRRVLIAVLSVFWAVLWIAPWAAALDGRGAAWAGPGPEPARAERHMVAAANPLAAQAGLEILRAGGSALDAAVATQLVLNLVEPQNSGSRERFPG